ncbi:uncharacterized protein LOC143628378 [Bidens hawaiensis]|uniref:uncharacterized protein LOC143628378 n=1 Tax=Bidens hawaiensis TaxID=980011 RepID=UPI0040495E4C
MVLNNKFRLVRAKLQSWEENWKAKEVEVLTKLKNEVEGIEKIMESRDLEEEEWWTWEECKKEIEGIDQDKIQDLHQKSRVNWAKFGDDNTAFYHGVINGRKAKNSIPGLLIDGVWVAKPSLVKIEIFKHFRDHFSDHNQVRPPLFCEDIKKIPIELVESLISRFSKDEIKAAVFDCGSDKTPGPDGFNFRFMKRYWSLLEDIFWKFLMLFRDGRV